MDIQFDNPTNNSLHLYPSLYKSALSFLAQVIFSYITQEYIFLMREIYAATIDWTHYAVLTVQIKPQNEFITWKKT